MPIGGIQIRPSSGQEKFHSGLKALRLLESR